MCRLAVGAVALLFSVQTVGQAATVDSVVVSHEQGRYSIDMIVRLSVSAAAAYAVMNDFAALPEVNRNVVLAKIQPDHRLHTIVNMCVSFFCRSVEQVQTVHPDPPRNLEMNVIPAQSDFSYGRAHWRFQALTVNTSRMFFDAQVNPKFWIPPFIGPWLVQRKMQQQALITSNGIERVAREHGD